MKLTNVRRPIGVSSTGLLEAVKEGKRRTLFVKWAAVNAAATAFLVALASRYGGRISGPSLVAIPAIILVYLYTDWLACRVCWSAHRIWAGSHVAAQLLHRTKDIRHYVEQIQYMAMLSTIFGFWTLLTDRSGNLHDRLLSGGGVAFAGTFVGIFASLILMQIVRMIESALECVVD